MCWDGLLLFRLLDVDDWCWCCYGFAGAIVWSVGVINLMLLLILLLWLLLLSFPFANNSINLPNNIFKNLPFSSVLLFIPTTTHFRIISPIFYIFLEYYFFNYSYIYLVVFNRYISYFTKDLYFFYIDYFSLVIRLLIFYWYYFFKCYVISHIFV